MKIQQYKNWYYHCSNGTTVLVSQVLIPFFRQYLPNSFHCFRWSCWGILISFFLLSQIEMAQPGYAKSKIYNIGTIHVSGSFVEVCVLHLVSLIPYFQVYHPEYLLLFNANNVTPYYDICYSPHIVWCTIGKNTYHSFSQKQVLNVPYSPATSTI